MSIRRATLLFWLVIGLHPFPVLADGGWVKENQSLSELMGREGERDAGGLAAPSEPTGENQPAAASTPARAPGGGDLARRLALWAVGLVVLASALLVAYRKWGRGAALPREAQGLQVIGRTALSPRHTVFMLRVADQCLLVGVSGDRMVSLGSLADPASRSEAQSGGFSARSEDQEAISQSRRVDETDLVPYRKQVDRLRGLLRGVREDFSGQEPAGDPPRT